MTTGQWETEGRLNMAAVTQSLLLLPNSVLCQYMASSYPRDIHSQSIKRHLYEKGKNSPAIVISSCLTASFFFYTIFPKGSHKTSQSVY